MPGALAGKRPRHLLAHRDPHRREKKGRYASWCKPSPPGTVVLFEDEAILREFPPLRASWAKIGQRSLVLISGSNGRRTFLPETGRIFKAILPDTRASSFQAFLHRLRASYRHWRIRLILDRHSAHWAGGSLELAERLRILPLFLPAACPEDNPPGEPVAGAQSSGGGQPQLWGCGGASAAGLRLDRGLSPKGGIAEVWSSFQKLLAT
jgi:hypothetical protein